MLCVLLATPALAAPHHAITLYGEPKYKAGFKRFDYVNPKAPKGGIIKLSYSGPFDSVNPYILKGVAAPGVAQYLFQSLMTPSYDEPQSYYGQIAQTIEIAKDRSWADFVLNPKARWHDGKSITADDVVWTFDTLKEKGHPVYRVMYKPISKVEKLDDHKVRFHFDDKEHRELPLIAASMAVLPKHYYEKVPFDKSSLQAPVGSGPYKITAIDPGRSITYSRVEDYWARDLPTERGRYNFDTIRIDVYRDDVVSVEGIKSNYFDYYEEYIARNWATAYDIPAVRDGRLIKTKIPHKIPRGMQAFLFNTRLAKFSDRRVREAIALTLDFQWMNKTLFYGAYERGKSFFGNTEFEAKGLPLGEELELLKPYSCGGHLILEERGMAKKSKKPYPPSPSGYCLPYSMFCAPFKVPKTDGSGYARENLAHAQYLLSDAGWIMKNGKRVHKDTGEQLTIEFLMTQRTFERVIGIMRKNLAKLGIDSTFRYVDASQYQRRVDKRNFDIVSIWWNQGLFFPGTEQYTFWHSSQAEMEGSQNLGGIKNPAVDDLVNRIKRAQTLDELRPAAQALDRTLLFEHYVIPHWNLNAWRILYWNKFGRPEITPNYNVGLDTWWYEPQKSVPLSAAKKTPKYVP